MRILLRRFFTYTPPAQRHPRLQKEMRSETVITVRIKSLSFKVRNFWKGSRASLSVHTSFFLREQAKKIDSEHVYDYREGPLELY